MASCVLSAAMSTSTTRPLAAIRLVSWAAISLPAKRNLDIEEIFIGDGSPVAGCSLATSEIRQKSSALVLAVIGENADPTYNPPPDFTLEVGMTLIVLGEREQLERLNAFMDGGA